MATRPSQYLGWCPTGAPSQIQQPSASLAASGWAAGQSPVAANFNYIVWYCDQFIQYLDGTAAINAAAQSLYNNLRLINGGYWSYSATSATLSWSLPFSIAVPGLPDTANTVATGSASISAGGVAYVNINVPITTTANLTSQNPVVVVSSNQAITVGQSVSGSYIQAGTTVQSLSGTNITLSLPPTTTQSGVTLTFFGTSAPTVQTATSATFAPMTNTIILARGVGSTINLGVNASTMLLRDGETKLLLDAGYTGVVTAQAGVALTQGMPVYISSGSDGRTAGLVYPIDASVTYGATRGQFIGVVMTSQPTIGSAVSIVTGGIVSGYSGLTPGMLVYANPSAVGGVTQTVPTTTGQYIIPIGTAIAATQIAINPALSATSAPVLSISAWPQYAATSEASLNTAIGLVSSTGGVILVQAPFTIQGTPTLPARTKLIGRGSAAAITFVGTSATLNVSDGCLLENVAFVNSDGTTYAMVGSRGSHNDFVECSFQVAASAASTTCLRVYMTSSGTRSIRNKFYGVLGSTTSFGIVSTGTDTIDSDSVYTTN